CRSGRPAYVTCPAKRAWLTRPRAGDATGVSLRRTGPYGEHGRESASGDADVVVLAVELDFLVGEIHVADRDDQAPVVADRAALHPRHHLVQFLQLDAGDPDGGEQVRLAAPHHRIG